MIHVTSHACERFVERIDSRLTFDQARAAILRSAAAIECAARFGCGTVRLGNGARLVLVGATVVTVKGRSMRHRFSNATPTEPAAPLPGRREGAGHPLSRALEPIRQKEQG